MIRRPPRSTPLYSSAASDVYKRQVPATPNRRWSMWIRSARRSPRAESRVWMGTAIMLGDAQKGKSVNQTQFTTTEQLPYNRVLVPAGQAMAQPFAQKHIQLGLFVRLVHRCVRVRIDAAKTPRMFGADDFGHAGVVIDLHFQLRYRQPGQAVLLAHLQGRGVRTCLLYTSPSPRDGLLSRMPSSA